MPSTQMRVRRGRVAANQWSAFTVFKLELTPQLLHPWPLGQRSASLESEAIPSSEGVATVTTAPADRWDVQVWGCSAQQDKSRVNVAQAPLKTILWSCTWRWSFWTGPHDPWGSSWFCSSITQSSAASLTPVLWGPLWNLWLCTSLFLEGT